MACCSPRWRKTVVSSLALSLVGLFVTVACGVDKLEFEGDHCTNLTLDGDETGEDCGGPTCPTRCPRDQPCVGDDDCASSICSGNVCVEPTCTDGLKNGTESDKDCGGTNPACKRCAANDVCTKDSDCASTLCTDGKCAFRATCDDDLLNGDESDTDCGGANPDCPRCVPGDTCNAPTDCDTALCTDGKCALDCEPGTADCDDLVETGCEIVTDTDVDNCGACDAPCDLPHATAVCDGGECAIEFVDGAPNCDANWGDCNGNPEDGCEVNLLTAPANCGLCDNVCEVPPGADGEILGTPTCDAGACGATCSDPYVNCDQEAELARVITCETNTDEDPENCSECDSACPTGASAAICVSGICGFSTCPAGTENCERANPDCEADLTSWRTCGNCATACAPLNVVGDPVCDGGQCDYTTCDPGYADCDGNRANGCEENTNTSNLHCGGCNLACPPNNVTTGTCVSGVCDWEPATSCASGFGHCDANLLNGCETDTNTLTDCGGCDLACSSTGIETGTLACVSGDCTGTCATGRDDCNDNLRDGCEINVTNDEQNCGACDRACSSADGATPLCTGSTCQAPSCVSGRASCDVEDTAMNGCETDLATSETSCGSCGRACSTTDGATPSCTSSQCQTPTCISGRASCDVENVAMNGCETDIATDETNCGACDRTCSTANGATPSCTGSQCRTPACTTGRASCDVENTAMNGCETNIATDATKCGGCTRPCSTANGATPSCASSQCQTPTCTAGRLSCDVENTAMNGCEVNSNTDTNNCGACGNVCGSGANAGRPYCVVGACVDRLAIGLAGFLDNAAPNAQKDLSFSYPLVTTRTQNPYRMIVLAVGQESNGVTLSAEINGSTAGIAVSRYSGNQAGVDLFYALDADLPASGAVSIFVNGDASNTKSLAATVYELINVRQEVPSPTANVGNGGGTCTGNASLTVATATTGSWVLSALAATTPSAIFTPVSGTLISQEYGTNVTVATGYRGPTTTANTTFNWNCSDSEWAHVVAVVRPEGVY